VIELEFECGLFALRQEKLNQIAALGQYKTIHTIPEIRARYGEASADWAAFFAG
jgi:lysyl-tRNA synthetase class 2